MSLRWMGFLAAVGAATSCISASTRALMDETERGASERIERSERARDRAARERQGLASDADLTAPLDRERVIAVALARDPGVASRAYQVRAMLHAARAEGSLPPPMLEVRAWNVPLARTATVLQGAMLMVEVQQTFPSVGSLDARARALAEDARVAAADIIARERDLARRVSEAWADYLSAHLHHGVHDDMLRLLDEIARVSTARLETGGNVTADLARIDIERSREARMVARYHGERDRARVTLNTLMRRTAEAPLGAPRDTAPRPVAEALDALVARAQALRATARQSLARVRAASARVRAARAERDVPMFGVAASYMQDIERPGLGIAFSMTLPWLSGAGRARVDEALARESAERLAADEVANEIRTDVGSALARASAVTRELQVLRSHGARAAMRVLESIRTAYASGQRDLLAWIDAERAVLDVRNDEAELVAELERAVSGVETAVGGPVQRIALDAAGEDRR